MTVQLGTLSIKKLLSQLMLGQKLVFFCGATRLDAGSCALSKYTDIYRICSRSLFSVSLTRFPFQFALGSPFGAAFPCRDHTIRGSL
jgi:hypothetical protein